MKFIVMNPRFRCTKYAVRNFIYKCGWLIILLHHLGTDTFGQQIIGLPQIINYTKSDFMAGTQTWDIKQDGSGIMYFANNEGMLTFDGSHWKVYPLPNKTTAHAIAIDQNNRIYIGAQNEIGFFSPGPDGRLIYTSLKNFIPPLYN